MNVGDRACVNLPDNPCFGWAGTVVDVEPCSAGNSAGPYYQLRLDRPLPAEYWPHAGKRHAVNHMLCLRKHEMKPLGE